MKAAVAIGWINDPAPQGQWGSPDELTLPLNDRGLLLADGLFETVLILKGEPRLLAEHLGRWQQGATLLGMAKPPQEATVGPLIQEAISRSGISCGALRLNWSRGSGGRGTTSRGIALPPAARVPHPEVEAPGMGGAVRVDQTVDLGPLERHRHLVARLEDLERKLHVHAPRHAGQVAAGERVRRAGGLPREPSRD